MAPWAADEEERSQLEEEAGEVVGRRLRTVRYLPMSGESAESNDDYDVADMGLELEMDDGSTWSATWELSGREEGLRFWAGRLLSSYRPDSDLAFEDVSGWPRWTPLIGQSITGCELLWDRYLSDSAEERWESDWAYWTVALQFEDGAHVYIARGDATDAERRQWHPDVASVSVFFDDAVARRYRAWVDPPN